MSAPPISLTFNHQFLLVISSKIPLSYKLLENKKLWPKQPLLRPPSYHSSATFPPYSSIHDQLRTTRTTTRKSLIWSQNHLVFTLEVVLVKSRIDHPCHHHFRSTTVLFETTKMKPLSLASCKSFQKLISTTIAPDSDCRSFSLIGKMFIYSLFIIVNS